MSRVGPPGYINIIIPGVYSVAGCVEWAGSATGPAVTPR